MPPGDGPSSTSEGHEGTLGDECGGFEKTPRMGTSKPFVYFDILDGPNGQYRHGSTIYVDLDIALALELGHDKASRTEVELVMESTVLHEFVHWARKQMSSSTRHVAAPGGKKGKPGSLLSAKPMAATSRCLKSGLS